MPVMLGRFFRTSVLEQSSKNVQIINFHEILSGGCRRTNMTVIVALLSFRKFVNEPENL